MNIEDHIALLEAEAKPLRSKPADEQGDLGAIVDKINALRAAQSRGEVSIEPAPRRGRPPKVRLEGEDA